MTIDKETKPWYVLDRPMVLGEGPIYRESDHTLHYVDCLHQPPQLHILSLTPEGDAVHPSTDLAIASTENVNADKPGLRVLNLEDSVTVMFFRKNVPKSYICLYYQGLAFLDEETGKLDVIKEIIPTSERHIRRFNDGGVDAKGRMWAAEIDVYALATGPKNIDPKEHPELLGRLWCYDPKDSSLKLMETGLACGNGLAWSPDNKVMYLNDSASQKIYSYDFDLDTGAISNKKLFYDARGTSDEPDGMVVDTEGNLWIAMFGGTNISVINSKGERIRVIEMPARNMACTTWGGPGNHILYSVSAVDKLHRDPNDQGGHLFRTIVDAEGVAKNEYDG
ncbi:hypothetical protein CANCADRAFT_123780 [Tortispora caseinolytica NRRL Y-17796]|uniref:SMP-30/Gluconolactonase/LRE-like region domain-containing protein n=1 Tax=Tortispora caseinolytica NRRL Y-17796 TaxID=767744 RepID=A0A1E4T9T2_9ASCO|nr:hypothetical protein CANCADRAFT_123780 [Tortispora caseinolytica NRRL Y-17796]